MLCWDKRLNGGAGGVSAPAPPKKVDHIQSEKKRQQVDYLKKKYGVSSWCTRRDWCILFFHQIVTICMLSYLQPIHAFFQHLAHAFMSILGFHIVWVLFEILCSIFSWPKMQVRLLGRHLLQKRCLLPRISIRFKSEKQREKETKLWRKNKPWEEMVKQEKAGKPLISWNSENLFVKSWTGIKS